MSGETGERRKEIWEAWLSQKSQDYFEELSEEIAFDQAQPPASCGADTVQLSASDFLSAASIQKRGLFVKSKTWFGLHHALRQLVHDWTIVRESLRAMLANRLNKIRLNIFAVSVLGTDF